MAYPSVTDTTASCNRLTYVVAYGWSTSQFPAYEPPPMSRRQRAAAELAARRRAHEAKGLVWPMRFSPPPLPVLHRDVKPANILPAARPPWPAALRSFARAS